MAVEEAQVTFNYPPTRAQGIVYKEFLEYMAGKNPCVIQNNVYKTATHTVTEIREDFTDAFDGRGGDMVLLCEATPTQGQYFIFSCGGTPHAIWFDTAGDATTGKPVIDGITAGNTLAANVNAGVTAAQCATAIQVIADAQADMTSEVGATNTHVAIWGTAASPLTGVADGDTGWASITGTEGAIRISIFAAGAHTGTITVFGLDANGKPVSTTQVLTGATYTYPAVPFRRINGAYGSSIVAQAVSIVPYGSAALVSATIAANDKCAINCRFYVEDGREAIVITHAHVLDDPTATDPISFLDNSGLIYIYKASELAAAVIANIEPVSLGEHAEVIDTVLGSGTEFITAYIAEVDGDAVEFSVGVRQTIITFDT